MGEGRRRKPVRQLGVREGSRCGFPSDRAASRFRDLSRSLRAQPSPLLFAPTAVASNAAAKKVVPSLGLVSTSPVNSSSPLSGALFAGELHRISALCHARQQSSASTFTMAVAAALRSRLVIENYVTQRCRVPSPPAALDLDNLPLQLCPLHAPQRLARTLHCNDGFRRRRTGTGIFCTLFGAG